jgi:hypothetical protein
MRADTTSLVIPEEIRAADGDLHPRDFDLDHALHDLNNVFVSILLNAQVIEWKLPSYSRIKRNVHEVERSAQRGGLLVKRILQQAGPMQTSSSTLPARAAEQNEGTAVGT